jgi:hypothetical protein
MTGPTLVTINGRRVDLRTDADRHEDFARWAAMPSTPTRDRFLAELDDACSNFGRKP